jgi:hypothetical protein
MYSPEQGYGLLSPGLAPYDDTRLKQLSLWRVHDGLQSPDSIVFRLDVPPGEYVLEILMPGGTRTRWTGTMGVNGKEIVRDLQCLSADYEGENPPPFWGVLRRVATDRASLVVTVRAAGQPTAVAGIHCYGASYGPLCWGDEGVAAPIPLSAPNSALCLQLINSGKVIEAGRLIDAMPDSHGREKASLLFALASRMEVQYPFDLVERASALWKREYDQHASAAAALNMRLAALFLKGNHFYQVAGWQWGRTVYPEFGIFNYINIAGTCYEEAASLSDHPLYPAAVWQEGKTAFWIWVEQHEPRLLGIADSCFRILKPLHPSSTLLAEYLGERRWDVRQMQAPAGTPGWAFLQKVVTCMLLDVLHYWVDTRQAANGEFGGKYDDDVEMLRWWPVASMAFNDSTALRGMKRLVDGIWNSVWMEKGFSRKVRDVEHSSEPMADTQPMMIGFDYGNPIYVERCMESVKGLRDLWTGINTKGHRHFRSSWYSATAIDTASPKDSDLAMNTRTVKAAVWLAWYNRHPFVMQFLKEWGDAWLEDCLRTDKGKPKGIVPAAVRYEDDAIGGHADNWHHPNMFWGYYNYNGGAAMLRQLLLTTMLLGEPKYLAPIELSLELVGKYRHSIVPDPPIGSEQWAAGILLRSDGFWEVIELWRLYTENTKYDDLIVGAGSPYLKFRLSNNEQHVIEALRRAANDVGNNLTLLTTEGYFTDRVELRDMRKDDPGTSSLLETMYLGAPLIETAYPFYHVSWKGFDRSLSVFVLKSTADALTARVYNHSPRLQEGELVCVDFQPGEYRLAVGVDSDGDLRIDSVREEKTFVVRGRNAAAGLSVSPGKEQLLEVTRIRPISGGAVVALPDLAVTKEELQISHLPNGKVEIRLPVHNVGIAAAAGIQVTAQRRDGDNTLKTVFRSTIRALEAPLDLNPKIEQVIMRLDSIVPGSYRIIVDGPGTVQELNKSNNSVTFDLP